MLEHLPIHGAKLIKLNKIQDSRGWFTETFRKSWIDEVEITDEFTLDCFSCSEQVGTLRGLHSQAGDTAPVKLVQILSGKIQDVILDARKDSPTYGQHITLELDAADPKLLYVPRGCYHGFVTLAPNTVFGYKMDRYYSPSTECGVAWNDPTLNIDWAIKEDLIISVRDQNNASWENAVKF